MTTEDYNGNLYIVGHQQITSINMDCYICKYKSTGELEWKVWYDQSEVDCKGSWIQVGPDNEIYATFQLHGGSNTATYFLKNVNTNAPNAFKSGLFTSYGSGGGVFIDLIVQVNPTNGSLLYGSFLMSRYNEINIFDSLKKTQPLRVDSLRVHKDFVRLYLFSWAYPPSTSCTQNRYLYYYPPGEVAPVNRMQLYYDMPKNLTKFEAVYTEAPDSDI